MPKRDDDLLVTDILQSCNAIETYVGAYTMEEFLQDQKTIDAVVRNFEIIGEASKLISEQTKNLYPFVEWRMMSDFRNILIHDYFGIDYEILWHTIKESLPYNYDLLKRVQL